MDFLTFNIRSLIDLNKNPHFTKNDLNLTSKSGGSFTIDNFDWKDSQPNHLDNKVYLGIQNLEEWYFSVNISKQIDEEYYFNIELLINKELEYRGLE